MLLRQLQITSHAVKDYRNDLDGGKTWTETHLRIVLRQAQVTASGISGKSWRQNWQRWKSLFSKASISRSGHTLDKNKNTAHTVLSKTSHKVPDELNVSGGVSTALSPVTQVVRVDQLQQGGVRVEPWFCLTPCH